MIDPQSLSELRTAIRGQVAGDRALLDQLRGEIRPLRTATRRIQPRATTSISIVGTDDGNNKLELDPFLVQLIRVVDWNKLVEQIEFDPEKNYPSLKEKTGYTSKLGSSK